MTRRSDPEDKPEQEEPEEILVPKTLASMKPEDTMLYHLEEERYRLSEEEVSFIVPKDCPPGTEVRFTHNGMAYKVTIGDEHAPGTTVTVRVGKPPPLSPRSRRDVYDFVRVAGEVQSSEEGSDIMQSATSLRRLNAYRSLRGQNMRPLLPDVEEEDERDTIQRAARENKQ